MEYYAGMVFVNNEDGKQLTIVYAPRIISR